MTTPTTPPLEIIVGQFYRTRGGQKARIYATDGGVRDQMIHGAYHNGEAWVAATWYQAGCYFQQFRDEESRDLVAPWIDKPEVNWDVMPEGAVAVAMDEDGMWCAFDQIPYISSEAEWMHRNGRCLYGWRIYPQHIPQWSGDWRDSLVIRPGHEKEEGK